MTTRLQFLSHTDMTTMYHAFMAAFADYVQDASGVTEANFTNRAIRNNVNLDVSVGIFDGDDLVGFTMVGLDRYQGVYAAYDAATGISKPYRGQGLAKAMFEFIVPALKERGVERFYLEAIQENEPAVRAYQKTGFKIDRELDVFRLTFEGLGAQPDDPAGIEVRPIDKGQFSQAAAFFDWQPTWDQTPASITRIPDEVLMLGAFSGNRLVGELVYYPLQNWVLSLAVDQAYRRRKIGSALMSHLHSELGERLPATGNIDHGDSGMLAFLDAIGSKFITNQYEMSLDL